MSATLDDTLASCLAPLTPSALPECTLELARFLLGKRVVRADGGGVSGGTIVETEAYPPGDPAAHAYRRMTPRNRSLFLRHGHAYIYRAYGVAWMLNVSSEAEGVGAGVLIRAIAPDMGTATMAARPGAARGADLGRGPGRLAAALAIDRTLDGIDLCAPGPLFLAPAGDHGPPAPLPDAAIGVSVRIGITRAAEAPWRFYVRESRFLSGPAWLNGGPDRRRSRAR